MKTHLCDDGYSRKAKRKSTSSWSVPRCYERLPPQDRGTKSLHFDSRLKEMKETKLNLRPTISKAISKNLLKHLICLYWEESRSEIKQRRPLPLLLKRNSACCKATKNRRWIASNQCDDCHVENFQRSIEHDEEEPDAPRPYRQCYLVTIAPAQDRSQGGSAIEENKHNKNENKNKNNCRGPEWTKVEVERKTTERNMRGIKAGWS